MMRNKPEFSVLLGSDFAGKSSALAELRAAEPGWLVISSDAEFLGPQHSVIGDLRNLTGQVLSSVDSAYTPEFLTGLLQMAVLHLKDEVMRAESGTPVLVDSYYYKILAKCRLAGVRDNPMFTWWRSFPQPRRIVHLEVSGDSAWRRCREGADLNPLEYYGRSPARAGFDLYQRDLRRLMREETRDVPLARIAECATPAETAQNIREVLAHELVGEPLRP